MENIWNLYISLSIVWNLCGFFQCTNKNSFKSISVTINIMSVFHTLVMISVQTWVLFSSLTFSFNRNNSSNRRLTIPRADKEKTRQFTLHFMKICLFELKFGLLFMTIGSLRIEKTSHDGKKNYLYIRR